MRVAILISGRGSNMERLIESCKINNKSASIELVFSNNAKASGLSYAKNRGIETSIIDHRLFEIQIFVFLYFWDFLNKLLSFFALAQN